MIDIPLGSIKQRQVLAALLCQANRPVTANRIIFEVWPDKPPASAKKNIQVYISNLRAIFRNTGHADRITYQDQTYRISVADDELDTIRFEKSVTAGTQALVQGEHGLAAQLFRSALHTFPDSSIFDRETSGMMGEYGRRLEEIYYRLLEMWAELEISLGDPSEALSVLDVAIQHNPFRERLFAAYLKSLVFCGRRTEALSAYENIRQSLAREMGISPSSVLKEVHQNILAGKIGAPHTEPAGHHVPTMLPRDLGDFVGRRTESALIARTLTAEESSPVAIIGPTGTGKTSLAVHAAHTLEHTFPHGRIFVRIRAGDDTPRPVESVLRELLRSIGKNFDFKEMELGLATWHSWLASRRCLIIIDDVPADYDVSRLLPATGPAKCLITSRARLATLESIHYIPLGVFHMQEALALLVSILGQRRVAHGREDLVRIVETIACLPLAVRMAGRRLSTAVGTSIKDYADRLTCEENIFEELSYDGISFRGKIASQWNELTGEQQLILSHIGHSVATKFTASEIASVLDCSVELATKELESLIAKSAMTYPDEANAPTYEVPKFLLLYAKWYKLQKCGHIGQHA
ncbi:AfsR/SARP family transcriptional regulator [Streptomyces sp. NBC_00568]|uniref:AfsR/SARP family transcriptional regulator n=1 Tax=Streptomyces sp. NBC_00568 TaxID=2975779 RepID=UPI00225A1BF7|nr:AfsR/SARP family transcriptional regulator [Streptomyces sp. NBC_00568]MCX4993677.1 NB-ARC domain-containing protein [Streptomyces sp. NBC_00568]